MPSESFKFPKWIIPISALLILSGIGVGQINNIREACVQAQAMESEISEVSKKQALYQLSQIQNKVKTQGVVTSQFSKLESDNVKVNMTSQRTIALGVMSVLNSDLKQVQAPTNGMMELRHSSEFYKALMDNAGNDYKELQATLTKRSEEIKRYEVYMADPVNRWYAHWGGYPRIDLRVEKQWTILTGLAREANETGVTDPINPLGKNAEIRD